MYTGVETAFEGQTVTAGGVSSRPTGAYLAKDLGIWSVMVRAQRNWGGR
jgi:hypothetical protein